MERPATLWRHPCPERTEMWRFMKDVVDKRGLRLEVSASLVLVFSVFWIAFFGYVHCRRGVNSVGHD